MRTHLPTTLLLGTLLALAPGCGGSAPAGLDEDCQFTASIRGADAVELCGFAVSSGRPDVGWSLQLVTPGGDRSLLFVTEGAGAGRPTGAEYEIANFQDTPLPGGTYSVLVALDGDVLAASGFHSTHGTLFISASSADSVSGTFTFEAVPFGGGAKIEVSGRFTSRNEEL